MSVNDLSLDQADGQDEQALPTIGGPPDEAETKEEAEETLDDVFTTRLKLAEAYLEMGDRDGAVDMLQEVIADGSEDQRILLAELWIALKTVMTEINDAPDQQHYFAFCVQYHGGSFLGWQRQRERSSVQGELEHALSTIADEPIVLRAAGRTDAGVHATGQVAAFLTRADRSIAEWLRGVNGLTSDAIQIDWLQPVTEDFHPGLMLLQAVYLFVSRSG